MSESDSGGFSRSSIVVVRESLNKADTELVMKARQAIHYAKQYLQNLEHDEATRVLSVLEDAWNGLGQIMGGAEATPVGGPIEGAAQAGEAQPIPPPPA
jgi:hypothetical protein